MPSSGQFTVIGISVSDVPSQTAFIWDTTLGAFRLLNIQDLVNGLFISGYSGVTGSGGQVFVSRIVSQNDPTTYIDFSSGIQIVVRGKEKEYYLP